MIHSAIQKFPYIGVRPFQYEDRDLFTGREADIVQCMKHIYNNVVRVLVVHGASGSGKSSFVQAGLLPKFSDESLTETDLRYKLLIPPENIVSGGPNVLKDLAKQVYQSVYNLHSPDVNEAQKWLNDNFINDDDFAYKISDDISIFCDLMIRLSDDPRTSWLIAIDHAERIFEKSVHKQIRKFFFELVRNFDEELFNAKLILVLRTERYGEFASMLTRYHREYRSGSYSINRLAHYFLSPPAKDSLIEIINVPTKEDYYHFSYDKDLPEKIVDIVMELTEDIDDAVGPLPFIQAICSGLYNLLMKQNKSEKFNISFQDFENYLNWNMISKDLIMKNYLEIGLDKALKCDGNELPLERHKWSSVLAHFVKPGRTSGIETKALSELELINYAREEECEKVPEVVIERLKNEPFSILTTRNNELILQHDVLAIALENNTNNQEGSCAQRAVNIEKNRIKDAAKFTVKDLYDDLPLRKFKLLAADLRFWDHKAFSFAIKKGFYVRLGLDLEPFSFLENKLANELTLSLFEKNQNVDADTYAVFTYPRSLMNDDETKSLTDVAILNAFTGYAIVAHSDSTIEPFQPWNAKNSFNKIFHSLQQETNQVVLAEDDGAKEFFMLLEQLNSSINGNAETNAVLNVEINCDFSYIKNFLEDKKAIAAVITCPMHALMHELHFTTVIDLKDVLLLQSKQDLALKKEISQKLRSRLLTHNSLNLSVSPEKPFEEDNHKQLLLRLASATLFAADYIRLNDDEVIEWIYENWKPDTDDKPRLQSVKDIYRRSIHYFPTSSYPQIYFDPSSPFYFRSHGKSSENHISICDKIYFELASLQQNYLSLAEELSFEISNISYRNGINEKIYSLRNRASMHASIYNFYDAVQILREARALLSKSGPKNSEI